MAASEQTYFSDDWLIHEDYKDWIVKTNDLKTARCCVGCKTFALSNMAVQAVKSHHEGKKQNIAHYLDLYFLNILLQKKHVVNHQKKENLPNKLLRIWSFMQRKSYKQKLDGS